MTSGKVKLASVIALAYTLTIVYASLQPFTGWRLPSPEVYGFLAASWPRYPLAADVVLNVLAYLPLGALLFAMFAACLRPIGANIAAVAIASLLSLALESAQMFLSTRIASNIDLLANAGGALIGALAGWVLLRRTPQFDLLVNCGLVVIAAWLLIQFQPAPFALGSGDFREMLEIPPIFAHAPYSYLLAEGLITTFAVVAVALMISLLVRPSRSAIPAIVLTLSAAFAVKSFAAALLTRSGHSLQWLTPGVITGTVGAVMLLALMLRRTPRARAIVALLCIAGSVAIVNLAPENPYQATPPFMLNPQPTHLLHFSHILQLLSQAWPLAAAAFLAAVIYVESHRKRIRTRKAIKP